MLRERAFLILFITLLSLNFTSVTNNMSGFPASRMFILLLVDLKDFSDWLNDWTFWHNSLLPVKSFLKSMKLNLRHRQVEGISI